MLNPSSAHANFNKTKGLGTLKRAKSLGMISTRMMTPTEPDLVLTHTERAFLAHHIKGLYGRYDVLPKLSSRFSNSRKIQAIICLCVDAKRDDESFDFAFEDARNYKVFLV